MRLLFYIFALFSMMIVVQFVYKELHATDENIANLFLRKQSKYVSQGLGSMEHVTFFVRNAADSDHMISRPGVLLKRPDARGTMLICHGYMCNQTDVGFLRMMFPDFNLFTFDFRAHGDKVCDQHCCTFGRDEAFDVLGAVNYLKGRSDLELNKKPLVVYAFSMGAVATIQSQSIAPHSFNALILDCPFDNSLNVIKRGLENLKFNLFGFQFSIPGKAWLEQYAFHPFVQGLLKTVLKTVANMDATVTNTLICPVNTAESVKNITEPCLFIHCKNDEKVSVDAARTLYSGAGGYKRLWLTAGRRHFDSFFYNPEKYAYKVNQFLKEVLDGSIKEKTQAKILEDNVMS